jgi:uncharacterized membrane protein
MTNPMSPITAPPPRLTPGELILLIIGIVLTLASLVAVFYVFFYFPFLIFFGVYTAYVIARIRGRFVKEVRERQRQRGYAIEEEA